MAPRFPLLLKILGWFFLNLAVLAAVTTLIFRAEFMNNLDWLLAMGARERLEAVRDLIIGELNSVPTDEWSQVLRRYGDAYQVDFALFDDEASSLVGNFQQVPSEVRERMLSRPPQGPRTPNQSAGSTPPPQLPPSLTGESQRRWRFRPPIRALLRTSQPTEYWLLTSARIDNPMAGDPLRGILVIRSPSISGGGLIFDVRPWLWLGAGAIAFSTIFWLPLVRSITRAIGRITNATRRIADGRFDVRIPTGRRDELGDLSVAINETAERLDGFVKGQKRFLGDIAHELCAPLAKLQMALGVLEQRSGPESAPYSRAAAEKAEQIAALVSELLMFSKASFGASAVHLTPVKIADLVAGAVAAEDCEGADIHIHVPEGLRAAADRALLQRAISNLIRNACRYAGNSGPIQIGARLERNEIVVAVADSGPGVPEEHLLRIFDAFYRVDSSRTRETGGVGLGLTIVKTCVESCGGTVIARNCVPHGLEVEIRLPSAATLQSSVSKTSAAANEVASRS
jgi:two-component system sensor histidine kinase CpxA